MRTTPGLATAQGAASTRTLLRGLAVFDCFTAEHPTLSLAQIAQMTGLAKATAFRLAHTLEAAGWLAHDGHQEYTLSGKFAQFAAVAAGTVDILDVARPVMREVAARSGQSVTLHTLSGQRRICLEAVGTARLLRTIRHSAQPKQLGLGGASLALLAFMPPFELGALLPQAARHAGCPQAEMLSIVNTARRQGYAVSHGGGTAGITGIAAPIFTGTHQAIHCISIVLPTPAAKGQVSELIELAKAAATHISTFFTAPPELPHGMAPRKRSSTRAAAPLSLTRETA